MPHRSKVTCLHMRVCRLRFWATRHIIMLMMRLTEKMLLRCIPRNHPSAVLLRGNLEQAKRVWTTALGPKAAVAAFDPNAKF